MIKHIVMWNFKEEALGKSRIENILKSKKMIEALVDDIDEIVELELGINKKGLTGSHDLVLYSVFKDSQDLYTYQNHTEHLKVAEFMKNAVSDRACVDFEV